MADQTVKIENDGGSKERVALELMKYIRSQDPVTREETNNKQGMINLYVDCLWATTFDRNGGQ